MRKVLALIFVVALLGVMSGPLVTFAQDDAVTLRLSSWGDPEQNAPISDAIDAFVAQHPNITVEQEFDPWDAYWDKKTTQAAGDQLPDVFAISNDILCIFAEAGQLADLTPYMDEPEVASALEQVAPGNLQRLAIGGKQLGFPFASGALLLYYNKDMFDEAGLEYPNPEWTLQDVLDAGTELTKDTNGDDVLDQWGYYPSYYNVETLFALVHRFGGKWFSDDAKTALSDSPEVIAAFQFMQDLSYNYEITPKPQDVEGIDNAFAAGLVAMSEDGTWVLSTMNEIQDFDWDITSIPLGFDSVVGDNSVPGNPNFVVSARSEHPLEAALLAAYLAGPEAQAILGQARGRMPVNPAGVVEWLSPPPENIGYLEQVMSTQASVVEPACVPHSTEITDLIYRVFEGDILTNSSTAEAVIPDMTLKIQTLLETP